MYILVCRKPVAKLYGQDSPVFRVQVDSQRDTVYSIGNDNTVKVILIIIGVFERK